MSFKDATEVPTYIGGLFESAFADPEIGPKLVATGLAVKLEFSDPEGVLVVDLGRKTVSAGPIDDSAPTVTMSATADTINEYWQGKTNVSLALAQGKIKVSGNVVSLLRLAPLGAKLYAVYIHNLKQDGRDDLLV
jgi:putative sterol carrier protein